MQLVEEKSEEEFLKGLSEEQKKAVKYIDGPQIISAGAGSGKTKVLVYKIGYLIKFKEISPYKILALTFTKKAADEMKIRVGKLINNKIYSDQINVGTFHSRFLAILKKNIKEINPNYSKNFDILEESGTKKKIKKIIGNYFEQIKLNISKNKKYGYSLEEIDDHKLNKSLVKYHIDKISRMKSLGITYDQYNRYSQYHLEDIKNNCEYFQQIYEDYEKSCEKDDVIDFDSILLYTFLLLKNNEKIRNEYNNKYDYILVDEYQDTNLIQFKILKLLTLLKGKITIIGDENQSIYKFRGARIQNFEDFKKEYPNSKTFTLLQNYRSTDVIVNGANALIKKNKISKENALYSTNISKDKIKIIINKHNYEEANKIAYIIKNFVDSKKYEYKDFAILYRANIQNLEFEKEFIRQRIPYKIFKKLSFFEFKINKIIINYLKLIVDLNDNNALKYILNKPHRGIGKDTEKKIIYASEQLKLSYFEIISSIVNKKKLNYDINIGEGIIKNIKLFYNIIIKYQSLAAHKSAFEIIKNLIKDIKLEDECAEEKKDQKLLNSFIEKIKEWEIDYMINDNKSIFKISDVLQYIGLFIDLNNLDNESNEELNSVKLMTIHTAKGLEFTNVFIVGAEEGFYPVSTDFYEISEEDLDEERRIFYVGLTRTKKNCFISYSKRRKIDDEFMDRMNSRFIDDIPDNLLEIYNDDEYAYIPVNKRKEIEQQKLRREKNHTIENNNFKKEKNNNEKQNMAKEESNKKGKIYEINNNIESKNNVDRKSDNIFKNNIINNIKYETKEKNLLGKKRLLKMMFSLDYFNKEK